MRSLLACSILAVAISLLAIGSSPVKAVPPTDPDWPCVQRKVPTLSPATMWSGPSIDQALEHWRDDESVSDLVPKLASRRTSLEEAANLVNDFAAKAGKEKNQKLTLLFAGVFSEINQLRSEIIQGIGRYVRGQRNRSAEIAAARAELQSLQQKTDQTPEDKARIDSLNQQINWNQRIFNDREASRTYVCEAVVILEQRLYQIAHDIQGQMESSSSTAQSQ